MRKKYITPKARSIEVSLTSILVNDSQFDPNGEGIEFGGEGGDEEIVKSKRGDIIWFLNE